MPLENPKTSNDPTIQLEQIYRLLEANDANENSIERSWERERLQELEDAWYEQVDDPCRPDALENW